MVRNEEAASSSPSSLPSPPSPPSQFCARTGQMLQHAARISMRDDELRKQTTTTRGESCGRWRQMSAASSIALEDNKVMAAGPVIAQAPSARKSQKQKQRSARALRGQV
jgi:hypothetical protein